MFVFFRLLQPRSCWQKKSPPRIFRRCGAKACAECEHRDQRDDCSQGKGSGFRRDRRRSLGGGDAIDGGLRSLGDEIFLEMPGRILEWMIVGCLKFVKMMVEGGRFRFCRYVWGACVFPSDFFGLGYGEFDMES